MKIDQNKIDALAAEHGEDFITGLINMGDVWDPTRSLHIADEKFNKAVADPNSVKPGGWKRKDYEVAARERHTAANARQRHMPAQRPPARPGTKLKAMIQQVGEGDYMPLAIQLAFGKIGYWRMCQLLRTAGPLLENREELAAKLAESLGCGCQSKAAQMDRWGVDRCREHMGEILGWLRDACNERGLPWEEDVARAVVELAIEQLGVSTQ